MHCNETNILILRLYASVFYLLQSTNVVILLGVDITTVMAVSIILTCSCGRWSYHNTVTSDPVNSDPISPCDLPPAVPLRQLGSVLPSPRCLPSASRRRERHRLQPRVSTGPAVRRQKGGGPQGTMLCEVGGPGQKLVVQTGTT